jgi:hypothetical protein
MMEGHEQRVIDEKTELDNKFASLCMFHGSDVFKSLDPIDQELLVKQADIMAEYSCILGDRIARFK